jgi:hypothetical protein
MSLNPSGEYRRESLQAAVAIIAERTPGRCTDTYDR